MDELKKSYKLTLEMEDSMAALRTKNSGSDPFYVLDASNGIYTTAFMDFHSGSGGEDASDWTRMLFEMYQRFAKNMNWNCKVVACQSEGSGLRSGVLRIDGDEVSSFLSQESGIHRLVRISPFDKNSRRHTSFASVNVTPLLTNKDQKTSSAIRQSDLIVDRFRSSGPGGQHVNKTESAVRLTHIPTGIVVECQNERNQHQNMEMAMQWLQARLDQRERDAQEEAKKTAHANKDENTWSNQIRSYVLHPYSMVKDHLFGVTDDDVKGVLDGNLREYIEELMRRKMYSDYGIAEFKDTK